MQKDSAIRKRTQIAKANRTMFIWIAGVSALIGFALVASIFLSQKLFFNEKVLLEKQKTVSTLDHNNSVVSSLEDAVRVLDTNAALASAKAQDSDQAVQVILDALPSNVNSDALGASLQSKLLAGIDGLTLDKLQVTPVSGIESLDENAGSDGSEGNVITFSFTVTGKQDALRRVLTNLERSIRTISVLTLKITSSEGGSNQIMTVSAQAYYEPAKTIQLEDKVVTP